MKINEEIMQKVAEKEKELANFKRCLVVKICPRCGASLTSESDSVFKEYRCTDYSCDFKHIV